ncbi:molybdopterin-synthase adenylyltransferase MoeB [Polynucleobacter sp. 30F-ANTBAC]|uniref:HesA/MoeB/ThiF family protein n=1 Tax=Polynucleobacter sp. 30F-ANTBAC TaxID=2689095 RepID=UPI001C0D8B1B|nr:molybdopterin-synthase adenylyltransferase MoeB [Polynucleobacter sp. 30F-ANTBAC]MBU3600157.1 molybdopterin-synthase adenylyltransferase MoeB [Polynucleobacter sp. 30F-ANTBAC]
MDDQDLLRYSRHILLDDIGIEGQEKILAAHVVIIGAGGLGSAAAPYLAVAGVQKITLIDHDTVDLTNLQRQIMHQQESIGQAKVLSGKNMLEKLNPNLAVKAIQEKADEKLLDNLLQDTTVVLDCSDNFTTRQLVNKMCVKHGVPLVSGSAIKFDGQVTVLDSSKTNAPCYACLFPPEQIFDEVQCSTMGVFSPLVGIIGAMQAAQALQLIMHIGEPLTGRLLLWDARSTEMQEIKVSKRDNCPVCSIKS